MGSNISEKIYTIRGEQVMLDFDLAEIYGYETKYFNRQVKNNIERFDEDFRFQLTDEEVKSLSRCKICTLNDESGANLRCKICTSSSDETFPQKSGRGNNIKYNPYAFTEQGIYMLMTVLKGELAVTQSKMLIRTFKEMKRFIQKNANIFIELGDIKKHLLGTDLHLEKSCKCRNIHRAKYKSHGSRRSEIQRSISDVDIE